MFAHSFNTGQAIFIIIIFSSFYFANVKHRQQQVTDAIVAGQQGSELH